MARGVNAIKDKTHVSCHAGGRHEAQIQAVIDRLVAMGFTVHRSTGVIHTVLGGVGPVDDFDPADFEVMDGVKEVPSHRLAVQAGEPALPAGRARS